MASQHVLLLSYLLYYAVVSVSSTSSDGRRAARRRAVPPPLVQSRRRASVKNDSHIYNPKRHRLRHGRRYSKPAKEVKAKAVKSAKSSKVKSSQAKAGKAVALDDVHFISSKLYPVKEAKAKAVKSSKAKSGTLLDASNGDGEGLSEGSGNHDGIMNGVVSSFSDNNPTDTDGVSTPATSDNAHGNGSNSREPTLSPAASSILAPTNPYVSNNYSGSTAVGDAHVNSNGNNMPTTPTISPVTTKQDDANDSNDTTIVASPIISPTSSPNVLNPTIVDQSSDGSSTDDFGSGSSGSNNGSGISNNGINGSNGGSGSHSNSNNGSTSNDGYEIDMGGDCGHTPNISNSSNNVDGDDGTQNGDSNADVDDSASNHNSSSNNHHTSSDSNTNDGSGTINNRDDDTINPPTSSGILGKSGKGSSGSGNGNGKSGKGSDPVWNDYGYIDSGKSGKSSSGTHIENTNNGFDPNNKPTRLPVRRPNNKDADTDWNSNNGGDPYGTNNSFEDGSDDIDAPLAPEEGTSKINNNSSRHTNFLTCYFYFVVLLVTLVFQY